MRNIVVWLVALVIGGIFVIGWIERGNEADPVEDEVAATPLDDSRPTPPRGPVPVQDSNDGDDPWSDEASPGDDTLDDSEGWEEESSFGDGEVLDSPAMGRGGITVHDAADMVAASRGQRLVVVIYSANCPRSQSFFPQLASWASSHGASAEPLVFATDDPDDFERFNSRHGAPFSPHRLQRWQPGELTRAMAPLGIRVPKTFVLPLVAVIDSGGRVVRQWQGITTIGPVAAAIRQSG